MSVPTTFTVAICTRNRALLLRSCLESLAADAGGSGDLRLIIVDNGSTDDTPRAVAEFDGPIAIHYVREDTPGLSRARNRALEACPTEYTVFLDDDARVDPGWARAIGEGIAEWKPDYFGGPYRPFYSAAKPAWFHDRYGSRHLDKHAGPLGEGEVLSGGNMGWRTSLLVEEGGFPVHLGMKGDRLGVGEETFLQLRLISNRPELRRVFLPEMAIRHLVTEEKLRVGYWLHRAWVTGWTHDAIRSESPRIPWFNVLRLLATTSAVLLATPLRNRRRYPCWQNWVMDRIEPKIKMLAIAGYRLRSGRHP